MLFDKALPLMLKLKIIIHNMNMHSIHIVMGVVKLSHFMNLLLKQDSSDSLVKK